MTEYILHIGLMKTGTTALQEGLSSMRGIIVKEGVIYPASNTFQSRHVQLVWSCVVDLLGAYARSKYSGIKTQQALLEIQNEVTSANARTCIISAEDFSLFNPSRFRPIIEHMGVSYKVVVYLRPQHEMIESMYKQLVKGAGIKDDLDDFVSKAISNRRAGATPLDYQKFLSEWSEATDSNRIIVRTYGESARNDIVRDFLETVGLRIPGGIIQSRANTSIEGPYIQFLRSVNEYLPKDIRHKFMSDVERLQQIHPCIKQSLLSQKTKEKIERFFLDSNNFVSTHYLNGASI
jgi:hypothetical protein